MEVLFHLFYRRRLLRLRIVSIINALIWSFYFRSRPWWRKTKSLPAESSVTGSNLWFIEFLCLSIYNSGIHHKFKATSQSFALLLCHRASRSFELVFDRCLLPIFFDFQLYIWINRCFGLPLNVNLSIQIYVLLVSLWNCSIKRVRDRPHEFRLLLYSTRKFQIWLILSVILIRLYSVFSFQ